MDEETVKVGLLMEAAQANQKLAETCLRKWRTQSQDLVGGVREEVHRAVTQSLQSLADENRRASEALRSVQRVASIRVAVWSLTLTLLCSAVPLALACWILPSPQEIRELSAKHSQLAQQIAILEARGARMDLRHCGEGSRLCVRVDRRAPAYGEKSDYLVVKGY
ncbi:MAG TPA: hypothetical protein VGL55_02910 [Steroidobacteraceae bacterium]|jgi:hypothetical protein